MIERVCGIVKASQLRRCGSLRAKPPIQAATSLLTKNSAPHELLFHKMSPYAVTAQHLPRTSTPLHHATRVCARCANQAAGRAPSVDFHYT
ncbi:uncharacterized protein M421DRAFT_138985 [Didymella exigua CBS 183.55]|uniref:Uncharacterized protein n=1 Tax=Didymella exigua CBS 183.55 TaxID=1150837 RepID=A0A6A5RSZ0_9PLEO|nr:uncharacterized protein M421DRAFT_138985 [Didymella exigua CBS 183.55]KAF1929436.1 hypothetical protein M421DRAFT_138985 [Didymella exigua CBS 183.55]